MEQLRSLFEQLKYSNVSTFIASGNVLFESNARNSSLLEKQIETFLKKSLGYEVDTFIRTRAEIADIARQRPFSQVDLEANSNTIHVGFLRESMSKDISLKLLACATKVDEFSVSGREFYWLCRIRTSESKVWTTSLKKIGFPTMTMRNMTTIRKLAAME
jgi:uncharacterized protein (DUF1697 family)